MSGLIQSESSDSTSSSSTTETPHLQNQLEQFTKRLSLLGLEIENETSKTENQDSTAYQDIPLSTSYVLNQVPASTNKIVNTQEIKKSTKVQIRFQPIGSVNSITPSVCSISSDQQFSTIILFLKKKLKMDTVYCYINNSFAPNPHHNIGSLWEQFKVDQILIVSYCATVAFG